MRFTVTKKIKTPLSKEELITRLKGQHLMVHNIDFEIFESTDADAKLKIIPHAEHENGILTLPITSINFHHNGSANHITLKSHIRRIDKGLPLLVLIVCGLLTLVGIVFAFQGDDHSLSIAYKLWSIAGVIFAILAIRMYTGYYDYIRKIQKWVVDNVSN